MTDTASKAIDYLIPFEKLHGLGNDFVVVNYKHLPAEHDEAAEIELTKKICDRNFGVGADGLIIISPVLNSEHALHGWRYYNSDGSIGEMCGNGIRCAAKYLYEHGLTHEETQFKIETLAGDISLEMKDDELVKVGMGQAREIKENQSLDLRIEPSLNYPLELIKKTATKADDKSFTYNYDYVSMGNPHAIFFFNDLSKEEMIKISSLGPQIEVDKAFPNKTNVEFARVIDPETIELIVWERGCGFTLACGTGACATVVSAIARGFCKADTDVTVKLPGGDLIIRVDTVAEEIFMTGKAEMSFNGNYNHKITRS